VATFQGKPAASADDGYYVDTFGDSFDNSSTSAAIVGPNYGLELPNGIMFVRIPNVTIPNGATINAATFDLVATSKANTTSDNFDVLAFDEDNSSQLADQYDAAGRPLTVAGTSGNYGSLTAGSSFTTPDFKEVVQAIVDRPGWSSGNAMQFLLVQSAGGPLVQVGVATYDHAAYTEPTLNITYTVSGTTAPFLPAFAGWL